MSNSKAEFIGAFTVNLVVDLDFFLDKYTKHLTDLNPLLQYTWGFKNLSPSLDAQKGSGARITSTT